MAALEQGMKVFQGIFKRIFRSTTKEFRKLYMLNRRYVDMEKYTTLLDYDAARLENDYLGDPKDIEPSADESMITDQQKMMKAQALMQRAMTVPGYAMPAVERRWLESAGIPDIQEVFPLDEEGNPLIKPPPNPEMEMEIADLERKTAESQSRAQVNEAQLELDSMRTQSQLQKDQADIVMKMAQAKQLDIEADLAPFLAQIKAIEAQTKRISSDKRETGK
jgi:hypothetical protein